MWHFGHADYKYLQCLFLRRSLWKYESSDVAYCIYLERRRLNIMSHSQHCGASSRIRGIEEN